MQGVDYQARVRRVGASGGVWSEEASFTTPKSAPVPRVRPLGEKTSRSSHEMEGLLDHYSSSSSPFFLITLHLLLPPLPPPPDCHILTLSPDCRIFTLCPAHARWPRELPPFPPSLCSLLCKHPAFKNSTPVSNTQSPFQILKPRFKYSTPCPFFFPRLCRHLAVARRVLLGQREHERGFVEANDGPRHGRVEVDDGGQGDARVYPEPYFSSNPKPRILSLAPKSFNLRPSTLTPRPSTLNLQVMLEWDGDVNSTMNRTSPPVFQHMTPSKQNTSLVPDYSPGCFYATVKDNHERQLHAVV